MTDHATHKGIEFASINIRDHYRRFIKKGFAPVALSKSVIRVWAKNGTAIDFWPDAAPERRWQIVGQRKFHESLTRFWRIMFSEKDRRSLK